MVTVEHLVDLVGEEETEEQEHLEDVEIVDTMEQKDLLVILDRQVTPVVQ